MDKKYMGYPRICLLNSEGDILIAYKTPGDYMIMDQWGICVDVLTKNDFSAFIDGTYDIVNSKGCVFNFKVSHVDMKPSDHQLDLFMKLKVKEQE
jgi:hypothetical protein